MSRPTDRPLARAHAHLLAGRHAEAIGAFRAALSIDPSDMRARVGLVKALVARGRRSDAAEGLVAAAKACMTRHEHDLALDLLGRAMELDPHHRLELHVDVAMVEHSLGRTEQALMRIEGVAEHYMSTGRTEEAAQLLRFAASWDQPKSPQRLPEQSQPAPRRAVPRVDENEKTVARARPRPVVEEIDLDMVTRVARMPERATKPSKPIVVAKPIANTTTKPIVTTKHIPRSEPIASAKPVVRATPPRVTRSATPAAPSLVDRLRSRAGLGLDRDAPTRSPRARPAAHGRRPRVVERAVRDDEVTVLFRRPDELQHALAY